MNTQRAQELCKYFDGLPNEHIITLPEVDLVPAVLGANVVWSHVAADGRVLDITAHDTRIRTAGDLRATLAAHGRVESNPSDNAFESLGAAIGDAMARSVWPIREQVVWARLRMKVLLEMLDEKSPGFHEEFGNRLREAADRDWAPFMDAMLIEDDAKYAELHKDWQAADQARLQRLLGAKAAERVNLAWKEWSEARQSPTDSSHATHSNVEINLDE